eukprot:3335-Ditylum_brightwellii.AAC.1
MHIYVRTWLSLAFLLQVAEFSNGYIDSFLEHVKEKMKRETRIDVDVSLFKEYCSRGKMIDVAHLGNKTRSVPEEEGESSIGDKTMRSREYTNRADTPGNKKRKQTKSET